MATLLIVMPLEILFSQTSPFSRYGIGELGNNGSGRNSAMGRTGIGLRSPNYLNNMNPASYSAIDTLSFLFDGGISGKLQRLNLDGDETQHSKIDFDYFAFGFPIARFLFTSVGLRPMSNNDYHFVESDNVSRTTAIGSGNISNLYGGIGLKLTEAFSIGAHVNYLFGDTRNTYVKSFAPGDRLFGEKTEAHISDILLDFGAQYSFNINNNKLVVGGIFTPKTKINGNITRIIGEGDLYDDDNFIVIPNVEDHTVSAKSTEMPMGFGVGVSYVINNKITLAADYSTKKWGDVNLSSGKINLGETADANYYSAGLEWVPNERTGTKYFERVRYRAGVHYANDYIILNGNQVTDMGVSFGFGFPLRRTNTSVNVAFDLGTKGTSEKGISKETYGKLSLNFTLHEYWFMKSRIR